MTASEEEGDVTPVTFDDLGRLGVGPNNRLYWDEEPVVTDSELRVGGLLNAAVVVGGLGTGLLAVLSLLRFLGFGAG